jgi:hypothetical protein
MNNNNNNSNIDKIISRYGTKGYEHLTDTLAYICSTARFDTYYFLDEFKIFAWISSILPRAGYVLENIDMILRIYEHNTNDLGRFKLLEFKYTNNSLRKGQIFTFGLLDRMLRTSQESDRYEGFYLVNVDLNNKIFIVNSITLTEEEFKLFLLGKLKIEPYRFDLECFL